MSENRSAAVGAKKSKNMLKRQRIAVIIMVAAVALLSVALFLVYRSVQNIPGEFIDPNDNALYHIKRINGKYALCEVGGDPLETTDDGYFVTAYGTLVKINETSGEYYVDSGREMIFNQLFYDAYNSQGKPKYPDSRILDKINVSNMHGEYSFVRSNVNRFVLASHPDVQFTDEAFVYLAMACAYPYAVMKLESPVTMPTGEIDMSEYGLATELREETVTNEDGSEQTVKYEYSPAKVTLTTANGDEYVIYFGDATITGNSYYVKYEGKESIYILASDAIASYILQGVEAVISPSIVHPMTSTDYVHVENFIIYENIDHAAINSLMLERFGDIDLSTADQETKKAYDEYYAELFEAYSKKACNFSFSDADERENSMYESYPYVSHLEYSTGYHINSTSISMMLKNLYDTTFVSTIKLHPSNEEKQEYGVKYPDKIISFEYFYTDSEGKTQRVYNKVYVSKQNSDGSYYAYSDMYDMIVCVDESSFDFLSWSELDWYDPSYMQFNINHIDSIKIESGKTDILFALDSSMTADGSYFPIRKTTFEDDKKNSYEIKNENGGFYLYANGEKLENVYSSDILLVGVPFTVGSAEGENYLFCEYETADADGDGTDDSYVYYYYNLTLHEGSYRLYATIIGLSGTTGEQLGQTQTVLADVAYTTDCFVTAGFSQYAFFVPKTSSAGKQLSGTYEAASKGVWLETDVFVTAKGTYFIVDRETGIWAKMNTVSNGMYIANKNSGKLQASGVDIDAFGVKETVYANTGEVLSYDAETKMLKLYDPATGNRRDAQKSEVAPGVWINADFYVSMTGDLITVNTETGDAGTVSSETSKFISTVYANGKELNYTYSITDTQGRVQNKLAIYNFQQFYTGLLFGSFEGICELDADELATLRKLDNFGVEGADNPCLMKMTINAKDAKGNEIYLVYRFYRISERKAYVTIEALDSADAESDSTKAYGSFFVLSSYVEKIVADANRVVSGVEVVANSKY